MSTLNDDSPHTLADLRSSRWYKPGGDEFDTAHHRAWTLAKQFNELANTDRERGAELLGDMFAPDSAAPDVFAPIHIEYGVNTRFGPGCFMNFNCVILDVAEVTVGAGTLFGPACQLITVEHPVDDAAARADGWERGRPITIGENCWFGAGAMVMPGVSIGHRCVIAAGAVVTKDIPDDSLVAGVPGKVLRTLG